MDVLVNLCGDSSRWQVKLPGLVWLCGIAVLLLASCNSESGEKQLATVEGASMFPVLPGNHYSLKCPECYFHFQIDAENVPGNKEAVCPNCGHGHVSLLAAKKQTPDLLNLQPINRPIERWDVVAFRIPDGLKSKGIGVKRVVGLPGDELSIVGGEILIDGELARRTTELQKQMRVEVNDSRFNPLNSNHRWQIDDGWMILDRTTNYQAGRVHGAKSWLTYEHQRCYKDATRRDSAAQIEDNYGCNQNVARSLNQVRDVVIAVDVTPATGAQVMFQFESGEDITDVMVDFSRSEVVVSNGRDSKTVALDDDELGLPRRIEVSNYDGQASVEINDQTIVRTNWELSQPREKHPGLKLRIGAARQVVQISRIRLWRDIYYFVESGRESSWTLGEDEYFLLGDNCPVSVDSRRFGPISRENIVGWLDLNRNR